MKSVYKLILTIVIGSAVFIGGFFVYHRNIPAPQQINTIDSKEVTSVVPDGFVVTEMGGGQRKIESPDGFSVVVGESIYSRNDGGILVLQDYVETNEGVGGPQGCSNRILVYNKTQKDIISTRQSNCSNDNSCEKVETKLVSIKNREWVKISSLGEFVGAGWNSYLFSLDNNSTLVVSFSCDDTSYENNILEGLNI